MAPTILLNAWCNQFVTEIRCLMKKAMLGISNLGCDYGYLKMPAKGRSACIGLQIAAA
jgi:hypothetical protein